ncbi:MAG: GNAT family N-acetyltransferase [Solimonas sp.]
MEAMQMITPIRPEEFPAVVELWEASVRATHQFLREDDIVFLRPLVLEYLPQLEVRAWRDGQGAIQGFVSVGGDRIEMLFVSPERRGGGIGRALLNYATGELRATKLDVNEQNPQGVGFYERMGFKVIGRSELDGQQNPFPLLHMELGTV